ncbi:hypothetical protein [Cognaticolwellia mytili]|uniref:hypothetical protein n=1 Tax=Cognaticolwellia mytili TaxID=1888913 RepID=UPI000A1784AA|nr:hypothetical protein [Cognaticolwellia mytili]
MKFSYIAIIVLAYCMPATARDGNTDFKKEIREVIESFRLAIIEKDKRLFKSLFYSENTPWIAVFSDEMVMNKRKKKANFPRTVNFGKYGPPEKMISETEAQEEKIWDIKIETDGYLGNVYFQYSDHRNGVKKAFGTEAWDLVRTESSWKIVSVKYTVTEL